MIAHVTLESKLGTLRNAFAQGLTPPENLTVDQWSDKYRQLPRVSSSEQGRWRTERFPFLREIMKELSPQSETQEIVVMKGAQLGFTECCLNWMFYTVDQDPAPFLYVQKTIDVVKKFSKQRFKPSADVTERINKILDSGKSTKDSDDTMLLKNFPGGIIIMGGANSAASLRSMPIERLALDEEESYDADIEEEGSPSDLAVRRTANFPNRKIFRLSTPKIKETSRIEPSFKAGTAARYHVPCPHCGLMQVIWWRSIKYEETETGDPVNVRMVCEGCGEDIPERYKTMMLSAGEWVHENPDREVKSYHISSLYSPLGFFGWADAVKMWLKANRERDKMLLKVFVNTVLGETWSESQKNIETAGLLARREEYVHDVPEGGLVLTAGVDVQEDYIAAEVVAFGKGQESWSVDYTTFMGDTELTFVWDQLDAYLQRSWLHEDGTPLQVAITAVDSGHRARVVYNFCRQREYRRVFPIKGRYGWGIGLIKRPKTRNQDGVFLFLAHVDELKSKVYSQLSIDKPGPGYCHFPLRPDVYDADYFKGLTAEQLITKRAHGRHVLAWELPAGRRNEPLDCRNYAIAALNILNPNFELLGNTGPLRVRNGPMRKRRARVHSRGVT